MEVPGRERHRCAEQVAHPPLSVLPAALRSDRCVSIEKTVIASQTSRKPICSPGAVFYADEHTEYQIERGRDKLQQACGRCELLHSAACLSSSS